MPDGEVVVIELDKDDKEYEVEMVDDKYIYEFEVDAVNGKILGMEKVKLDDDEEEDDETIININRGAVKPPCLAYKVLTM